MLWQLFTDDQANDVRRFICLVLAQIPITTWKNFLVLMLFVPQSRARGKLPMGLCVCARCLNED